MQIIVQLPEIVLAKKDITGMDFFAFNVTLHAQVVQEDFQINACSALIQVVSLIMVNAIN